ncbi:hypothetical protein RCH09_001887 [Actimicrobium sp. GrIS 1.19]|uniref:hypothetical protein n=1 Tax=Actimicrobium sp. GrIS 1.19 TaxID=3071708 RepID=UPI002DFECF11|nr:hypothetical protein [Actimicrobium sp. GrIS 1.19]
MIAVNRLRAAIWHASGFVAAQAWHKNTLLCAEVDIRWQRVFLYLRHFFVAMRAMIQPLNTRTYNPSRLLDFLAVRLNLHSEKALSKALYLSCGLLQDIRALRQPIAGGRLLCMQEVSGLSIEAMRHLMGDRRRTCRMPMLIAATRLAVTSHVC